MGDYIFLNPDGNEIMDIPSFLFFCTTDWKNIISITSHEFATTTDGEVSPSFNLARLDLNKDCCLKLFTNKECDYFSHSICSFYQLYFNWNNYSIKFVNWLFSMIAKSPFETFPKQPRTTWRHNAAATTQGWGQIRFIKYKYKYIFFRSFKYKYKYKYTGKNLIKYKYKYKYSSSNTNTNTQWGRDKIAAILQIHVFYWHIKIYCIVRRLF